jgi:hypothetical protein
MVDSPSANRRVTVADTNSVEKRVGAPAAQTFTPEHFMELDDGAINGLAADLLRPLDLTHRTPETFQIL